MIRLRYTNSQSMPVCVSGRSIASWGVAGRSPNKTLSNMATCGYSSYVGGSCGPSPVNPDNVQCVPVGSCCRDIKAHLKALDVRDASLKTEAQLLLARAGNHK